MKTKGTSKGIMIVGSLRSAGVTTYMKQGKLITRTSSSIERRSNTLPQFIQRQKMRHTIALWKILKYCKPMFTEHQTAYLNFSSLANRLPVVYVPKYLSDLSFLMPGIPMSDGKLPAVSEQLGEVDGMPALVTDRRRGRGAHAPEGRGVCRPDERVGTGIGEGGTLLTTDHRHPLHVI